MLPTSANKQYEACCDDETISIAANPEVLFLLSTLLRYRLFHLWKLAGLIACCLQNSFTVVLDLSNSFNKSCIFCLLRLRLSDFSFACSTSFQIFINELAAKNPNEFKILILDNGAFHHARSLVIPDNMAFIFLPPYSPELNLQKKCGDILKTELAWLPINHWICCNSNYWILQNKLLVTS